MSASNEALIIIGNEIRLMNYEVDFNEVNDLLKPAKEAMEIVNRKYGLSDDEALYERDFEVYVSWESEDGIERNLTAGVDPETYEMSIEYNAWRDKDVVDSDDKVRSRANEEIATISDPTDEIGEAVQKAYKESVEVTEDDLDNKDVI